MTDAMYNLENVFYSKCTDVYVLIPELPPVFTKPLTDQTVKEHDTVVLECEVSKPDADVVFLRKGKKIKPSDQYKYEVDGLVHRLTIKDVPKEDTGEFTAKLRDDEKTTAKLTVEGGLFYFQFDLFWVFCFYS